ncbi:hypothetical protein F5146DRAFT_1148819 [Armillaria mellea]|nr:hypothetical protein F5146DRAFT_1148819 [Armillaria mellea]
MFSHSRYSVLSEDYDPLKLNRPRSIIPKSPSLRSSIRPRNGSPVYKPGQICLIKESAFTPLSVAMTEACGNFIPRNGLRLKTFGHDRIMPVSSGKERSCIIMDVPGHLKAAHSKTGHFVCLMATFDGSSEDQYESFSGLLRRFVVPVEPNQWILFDSGTIALKTDPAWHNPLQWVITFVMHTNRPMKPYISLHDGKSRRLPSAEYKRLVQHCAAQRRSWTDDTNHNETLKQEMFDELVNWKPKTKMRDSDKDTLYTCRSIESALSVNSIRSCYAQSTFRRSTSTLHPILEDAVSTYPKFTPSDFPPLPSKLCVEVC